MTFKGSVPNASGHLPSCASWIACMRSMTPVIGAMRELEDNAHLHSRRAQDGLVAFRGTVDEFEFVVADSGIGVLQGLREAPRYAHLKDRRLFVVGEEQVTSLVCDENVP